MKNERANRIKVVFENRLWTNKWSSGLRII